MFFLLGGASGTSRASQREEERKSSWFACHKHQLFDCDWQRRDLGTVLPGEPRCKSAAYFPFPLWQPGGLLRWLSAEVTSCQTLTLKTIQTLLLNCIFFAKQLHGSLPAAAVKPPPHACQCVHSACFASFVFLRGSGWGGKIMSLSEKQASCHATKEPSPEKLWSNHSHWLTNFFFFKSNILFGRIFAMQQ